MRRPPRESGRTFTLYRYCSNLPVTGSVAVALIQTVHIDVKPKEGEAMSLDLRQTLILEKRSGDWKIVHEHLSAPLELGHPH